MTPLNKPVTRLCPVEIRDGGKRRRLVVTVHAEYLTLRLHGRRAEEVVSLEAAYFGAIKARVFRERMERGKLKASRRRSAR